MAGGRNSGQIALLEGKSGVFLLVRDLAGMKLFRFDPAGNTVMMMVGVSSRYPRCRYRGDWRETGRRWRWASWRENR